MAGLTVSEDQMWVNLSPYEKERIIPASFGQTEMGRDLLAQDYLLKQLSASLSNPETELGAQFWKRVRARAKNEFVTDDLPMNTFNKIWIVPETATIYEHGTGAFIVDSHLKVMLDTDYLAVRENAHMMNVSSDESSNDLVRELLIPEIEHEVNNGALFANLRQIYNSLLLATWYKRNLQESLLSKVYVNQNKTSGVSTEDPAANQKIYEQYLQAFKTGVYDYIKEEYDPTEQKVIPHKYFSGGADLATLSMKNTLQSEAYDAAVQTINPTTVSFKIVPKRFSTDAAALSAKAVAFVKDFLNKHPVNENEDYSGDYADDIHDSYVNNQLSLDVITEIIGINADVDNNRHIREHTVKALGLLLNHQVTRTDDAERMVDLLGPATLFDDVDTRVAATDGLIGVMLNERFKNKIIKILTEVVLNKNENLYRRKFIIFHIKDNGTYKVVSTFMRKIIAGNYESDLVHTAYLYLDHQAPDRDSIIEELDQLMRNEPDTSVVGQVKEIKYHEDGRPMGIEVIYKDVSPKVAFEHLN
jgi:hypothetical protein